jgi:hypothetical protein
MVFRGVLLLVFVSILKIKAEEYFFSFIRRDATHIPGLTLVLGVVYFFFEANNIC